MTETHSTHRDGGRRRFRRDFFLRKTSLERCDRTEPLNSADHLHKTETIGMIIKKTFLLMLKTTKKPNRLNIEKREKK